MAVAGDIAEIVHEQTYLGQIVNNVFYYECIATDNLANLAAWFEANIVGKFKDNQVDLVTHTNLRLRNLFQLGEVHEEPLTGTGLVSSLALEMPSFMAYALRLDHGNGEVRPGFKRIVGVDENSLTDALVSAARITTLTSLGGYLVDPATVPIANWRHVVVGRICETPNPVVGAIPSCLKYRLPTNSAEASFGVVQTVEVYSQPSTQNSRKWYT